MLIIGHRGARGLAPENTLASMEAGIDAGAIILEFDVHITKDNIPVIIHDDHVVYGNKKHFVRKLTYSQLRSLHTDAKAIPTLAEILNKYWKKVYLNIEVKGKGSGKAVAETLQKRCKSSEDWDHCLISSFRPKELRAVRNRSAHASLGLIHKRNPLRFLAHYRNLDLSAVGWHRLYINPVAIETAKKLDLFTYVYTVNRPDGANRLAKQGIDAVVTDFPDKIYKSTML